MKLPNEIEVNLLRFKCIGCSYCVSIAPEVFTISHLDGKVTNIVNPFSDEETQTFTTERIYLDVLKQSETICPVKAIKITS
jgi:ferredoxin